jgi:hypothetical protein
MKTRQLLCNLSSNLIQPKYQSILLENNSICHQSSQLAVLPVYLPMKVILRIIRRGQLDYLYIIGLNIDDDDDDDNDDDDDDANFAICETYLQVEEFWV